MSQKVEVDQYFVCIQDDCLKSHKIMGNMKEAQVHWGHKCQQLTDIINQTKSQQVQERYESYPSVQSLRTLLSEQISKMLEKIQIQLNQKEHECEKFILGLEDPLHQSRQLYKELVKDEQININQLKKYDAQWLQLFDQNHQSDNLKVFQQLLLNNLSILQEELINTITLNQLQQTNLTISKSSLQKQCEQLNKQILELQQDDKNKKCSLLQFQSQSFELKIQVELSQKKIDNLSLNHQNLQNESIRKCQGFEKEKLSFELQIKDLTTQIEKQKEQQNSSQQNLLQLQKTSEQQILQLKRQLETKENIIEKYLGLLPINYEWDTTRKNGVIINGLEIKSEGGCNTDRFVLSKQPIPQKKCYFEIIKHYPKGCYDSFGLCLDRQLGTRNGQNNQGWAVRLYGEYYDFRSTGSIHNGQSQNFFDKWEKGDKIGILYDPQKKSMTYYRNGISLGTPFTNVEGQLFICLEVCHNHNSEPQNSRYSIVQNPQLPNLI